MERSKTSLRPVEFKIVRIPDIRVLFADYEDAVIQILTAQGACHFRGTEHRLWLFQRALDRTLAEAFADQATERARSQASRLCALEDRRTELQQELERLKHRLLVEQGVRTRLERELTTRDGFNRARLKVERMTDAATAGQSTLEGVSR